jgi:RNA-directed DNA polymerase
MKFDLDNYLQDLSDSKKPLPVRLLYCNREELKQLTQIERDALSLLKARDVTDLCRYVGVPYHEIEKCINQPRYNEILLSKSNGKGKRLIQEPSMSLKQIQARLNLGLGAVYTMIRPEQVHGFVRGKKEERIGIVSNAAVHVGSPFVLNMDLHDFFHSVRAGKVQKILGSKIFAFNDHLSVAIALLCSYQGRLPQGASTSPVLSNLVCLSLDEQLRVLAIEKGWKFTRYADDLTFSGGLPFTDEDIMLIRKVVESEGFKVNERKTRRKGACRKQKVTGLIVNKKVNVDRKLIRKVRAMLYDVRMNGLKRAADSHFRVNVPHAQSKYINRLQGYVSFIGMVRGKEDGIYLKFRTALKLVMEETLEQKPVV